MPTRPDHIQFAVGPGKTKFERLQFADATMADLLRRFAQPGESLGLTAKRLLGDYLAALTAAPRDTAQTGAVDHLTNAVDTLSETLEQLQKARRLLTVSTAVPEKTRRSLSVPRAGNSR